MNSCQGRWRIPSLSGSGMDPDMVEVSSDFDSGNCGNVQLIAENTLEISIAPDCAGTQFQTHSRTWFYFSVTNVPRETKLNFVIRNMGQQKPLFNHGMKPVIRIGQTAKWDRIPGAVHFSSISKQHFQIQFSHKFLCAKQSTSYFAFCYPHTYTECQALLNKLEARYGVETILEDDQNGPAEPESEAPPSAKANSGTRDTKKRRRRKIYFHRACLAKSLQNRRVDLLTITNAKKSDKNKFESQSISKVIHSNPSLFPLSTCREGGTETSCWKFEGKPIVFVSARVHPGETPSSFTFLGFLEFILDEKDPRACRLRDLFVFKMVPMLNPDGVALGHYRANTLGQNLNRFYSNPEPLEQPAIAAVKALLTSYDRNMYLYLDMHGHAAKRGCFLYGNYIKEVERQVENMAYSRLVGLNTPYMDLSGCDFSQKNMLTKDKNDQTVSKAGSGRVAIFKSINLTRCYTLECNYNIGKVLSSTAPATCAPLKRKGKGKRISSRDSNEDERKSTRQSPRQPSPERTYSANISPNSVKYTPVVWKDVGKACAVAILDMVQQNPWSRIDKSMYKSLDGVHLCVRGDLRQKRQQPKKSLPRITR